MKTIVSVSQLSIYRAVLMWYLEKRSEGDNICPNTDFNISQEVVTKLTRHENLGFCFVWHGEIDHVPYTQNASVEVKFLTSHVSKHL